MRFQNLKENLNSIFNEVVNLITELISINRDKFSTIVELNRKVDNILKEFVTNLLNEIEKIYFSLTQKLTDINIEKLKKEIDESTSTFLDITVDLELLSYNTICKTLNLEKRGATIAYISQEIKKHSDRAKQLMKGLTDNFNNIYKNYTSTIRNLEEIKKGIDLSEKSDIGEISSEIILTSDISKLIEYLQFHDIYNQQIQRIEESFNEAEKLENDFRSLGKKLKIYEEAQKILEEMKEDLSNVLREIYEITKEYIYNINTDFQNTISKTEIVRSTLENVFKKGEILLLSIERLTAFINEIFNSINLCNSDIKQLEKFSKSFYVLIVLSSIEISRIGEKSMLSLTDFMNKTHTQLIDLMEKLSNTVKVWEGIALELNEILNMSKKNYEKFKKIDIKKELKKVSENNTAIENNLEKIKEMLSKKDYNRLIENYKDIILDSISEMVFEIEKKLNEINLQINDEIRNSREFLEGYNSDGIKIIKEESEDDLSNIELF